MASLQPQSVAVPSFKVFSISGNVLKEAGVYKLLFVYNCGVAIPTWPFFIGFSQKANGQVNASSHRYKQASFTHITN